MARKRVPACIRCDAEGPLSKVGDHRFCKACLAESRRHVYGTPEAGPPETGLAAQVAPPVRT